MAKLSVTEINAVSNQICETLEKQRLAKIEALKKAYKSSKEAKEFKKSKRTAVLRRYIEIEAEKKVLNNESDSLRATLRSEFRNWPQINTYSVNFNQPTTQTFEEYLEQLHFDNEVLVKELKEGFTFNAAYPSKYANTVKEKVILAQMNPDFDINKISKEIISSFSQ